MEKKLLFEMPFRFLWMLMLLFLSTIELDGQSCDCSDYLYLNDTDLNATEKFKLSETAPPAMIGNPWLDASDVVDAPHGIAADINGFLYIGERDRTNLEFNIKKFNCDGELIDADLSTSELDFFIEDAFSFNHFSHENYLYVHLYLDDRTPESVSSKRIEIYDLCDGSYVGCQTCGTGPCPFGMSLWGLTKGSDGYWYGTENGKIYRGPLDPSTFTPGCNEVIELVTTSVDMGLDRNIGPNMAITGIAQDAAGNLYGTWSAGNGFGGPSQIWKRTPAGVVTTSLVDDAFDSDPNDNLNWFRSVGVVWSPMTGNIYVSTGDDCVAAFDSDLNYLPNQSVHVKGLYPKGIGLLTECCPTQDLDFTETICSNGDGERVFL